MFARAISTLIVIATPLAAFAGDLRLSAQGSVQYDTNTTRSDDEDEGDGDFIFRIGPTIRVSDEFKKLQYYVRYTPTYQKFTSQSQFDHLSHNAGGSVSYRIGDRTLVSLTENFSLTQAIDGGLSTGEAADGTPLDPTLDTETRDGDITRNHATFEAQHTFTPRLSGQFSVAHDYFNSDNSNTSKHETLSTLSSLSYAIGARDRVGMGGGFTWQQFEGVRGRPGSDTQTYRVFASWLHNFGQNTEFLIRAGPALISTKQEDPDDEGLSLQYLRRDVFVGGTVADAYRNANLPLPEVVIDVFGNVLAPTDPVVAGSVLIPTPLAMDPMNQNSSQCDFGSINGFDVFNSATCPFSQVAQPGDAMVMGQDYTDLVRTGTVDFAFLPGEDPGSTDSSTVTYFGEVSLTHHWSEKLTSLVSYSRSDSAASSLGSSTVSDRVTVGTTWDPAPKWNLDFRADWLQRKSANDLSNTFRSVALIPTMGVPQTVAFSGDLFADTDDESIDTTYWSASARAAYRITRHFTISARLTYQKQDTKSAATTSNGSFGDFIAFVGVSYDLDPIHF